jgi:hypothetical protein
MAPTLNHDDRLEEILSRLTDIAQALVTSTPPPRTPVTQEQSATIVDYLVLREVVGRRADETSRVVGARRHADQVIEIDPSPLLCDDGRIAVFTRRGTPAEVVQLDPGGVDLIKSAGSAESAGAAGTAGSAGSRRSSGSAQTTESTRVTLQNIQDSQPIIRIEIRRADDTVVALGPRLSPVA